MATSKKVCTKKQLELRKEWVRLLRSGYYTQKNGAIIDIKNPRKRCCLGVPCSTTFNKDVKAIKRKNGEWVILEAGTAMHPKVAKAMGFSESNPSISKINITKANPKHKHDSVNSNADGSVSLMGLNDHFLWNFEQIAKAIELEYIKGWKTSD